MSRLLMTSRTALRGRRPTFALAALVAFGFAGAAWAYLTTTGAGSASASIGSISAPSNVTATQTGADIAISWDAATLSSGAAVDGYRVTRSGGTTICGSPTLVTGLSCTDTNAPSGTISYTVTAVYRSWTASATSTPAATLVAPTITSKPSDPSADSAPSISFGSGGAIRAWGRNSSGQLGDGTSTNRSAPVAVSTGAAPTGTTFSQVSAGGAHSVALSTSGELYAWGSNANGRLGDGTATSRSTPVALSAGAIPAGTTFTGVAAGGSHSLALSSSGKLYAWGYNAYGQLGDGTTTTRLAPVAVSAGAIPAGTTFAQVAAGARGSVALSSTGKLYAWGYNWEGQVGNGTTIADQPEPVAVSAGAIPAGTTITQVAAGGYYNIALGSNGKLYAWGYGGDGELGDATGSSRSTPVAVSAGAVPAGTTFSQVAAGERHAVALGSDGKLYAWGRGYEGQLGNGATTSAYAPVAVSAGAVPAGTTYTRVSAGVNYGGALGASGQLYAWGRNFYGEVGDASTTTRSEPVAVSQAAGTAFSALASSPTALHVLALAQIAGAGAHECQLDGGAFAPCTSPRALSGLADGSHTFKVHAVQGASTGPDTTYTWTVDHSAPSISAQPANPTTSTSPSFSFSHTRAAYTFKCQLDGGGFTPCTSPKAYSGLALGSHTFQVVAVDADGVSTAAASSTWVITNVAPAQSFGLAAGATGAYLNGTTVYYAGASPGTLALVDSVTASSASAASAAFPAIATAGWTHGAETVTTPAGGPYTSSAFSWTAGPSNPTGYSVTATDTLGTSAQQALTFVNDGTAPGGPALTVGGTAATAAGSASTISNTTFTIGVRTNYSETQSASQSGLSSSVLTVQSATLTHGTCGALGSGGPFTSPTTVTGTTQPAGILIAFCYRYVLTGTDNVGNTASISTTVRANPEHLYWGSSGSIGRANVDGTSVAPSLFSVTGDTVGIAVNETHIFWSRQAGNTIGRASLDGASANASFITGTSDPYQIALDGSFVYWGAFNGSNAIARAPLAGGAATTLVAGAGIPIGAAVNGSFVYWANAGTGKIGRATISGTSPDPSFISTGGDNLGQIAIDGTYIYWASRGTHAIGRAKLDGTGIESSFISTGGASSVPFGLAVDGSHIYWADSGTGTVGRANLDGTGVNASLVSGLSGLSSIAVGS